MKKLILIIILLTTSIFAQQNKEKNPFKMVDLPDSLRLVLGSYIKQTEKLDTVYTAIYVFNLVNKKDYIFHDGIYYFRLMSPHISGRVFIYNLGKIKIFNSTSIVNLLEEYLSYIKTEELPEERKITYLKALSKFLELEYKSNE